MAVEKVGEKYRRDIPGNDVVATLAGVRTLFCCGEDTKKMVGQPTQSS